MSGSLHCTWRAGLKLLVVVGIEPHQHSFVSAVEEELNSHRRCLLDHSCPATSASIGRMSKLSPSHPVEN